MNEQIMGRLGKIECMEYSPDLFQCVKRVQLAPSSISNIMGERIFPYMTAITPATIYMPILLSATAIASRSVSHGYHLYRFIIYHSYIWFGIKITLIII